MMVVMRNSELLTVVEGDNIWRVPINQCYISLNENVYKLDDTHILFEYERDYALLKIIDKCRKVVNNNG